MRTFVLLGGIGAFLAVAFGAFGAHALRSQLPADMMAAYQTGVQYQMAHALGLILIGLLAERRPGSGLLRASGWLLAAGILLFSGSLYVLALSGVRVLGAITPFGGICFLVGWALLIVAFARDTR
jgi:uncharacterized membrane protein YgdD (TMEM256/DUF423 family)